MIPKTGNVSLVAVRDDLDLTGNFSLRASREAKDKLTWDTTTDISLLSFRGNVLGEQYKNGGSQRSSFQEALYNGGQGSATIETKSTSSQSSFPDKPSTTQVIYIKSVPSIYAEDKGREVRHSGFITEGGSYRLRCHVARMNSSRAMQYSKIAVVQHSAGWFSGASNVAHDDSWGYGANYIKYEKTINLQAGKPYVSVIVYAICPANSDAYSFGECYYTALQLDKI